MTPSKTILQLTLSLNIGNFEEEKINNSLSFLRIRLSYGLPNGKKNTWCKCQQDKNNGTSFYRSKADLTIDVRAAILPIYNDLTKQKKNNEMLVWKDAKRK